MTKSSTNGMPCGEIPVINDTYEPGSTFKLVTTSAALEEGVATPQSTFYSSGTINVAGRIIKSWRWYNPLGIKP
ncbi:hypothetical protein JCM11672_36530 [Alkaliphilus crotonatoxidans]